jgi:AcrR family transcriptional regulator
MKTGRREQKKRETLEGIVAAATALFGADGFENTKIEDIAGRAGVSPGTVYNYFGTKGAVLVAVAASDVDGALEFAADSLDLTSGSPVGAMMPVIDVYMAHVGGLGRDLLKEMLRAGFDPTASDVLAELVSLDERAVLQIALALGRMQRAGMVDPDTDIDQAAMLVYSIVGAATLWWVSVPDIPLDAATDLIRTQLVVAFDGIAVERHAG